jgi:uncharacterized membrane protein YbhN (UPF0104 family)
VSKFSRLWLYGSSAAVILAGYYFLKHGKTVNFSALGTALRAYPTTSILLAFLFVLIQIFCQICRFWALVPSFQISWMHVGRIFTLGQFLNSFAPARAGDFLKVFLFAKKNTPNALTLPQATGVMLADKVIDVISLFLLCLLTGVNVAAQGMHFPSWLWPAVGAVILLILMLLAIPPIRKKAALGYSQLKDTLNPRQHPKRFLLALSFSLGAWTFESLAIKTLCAGQNFPITFAQSVWALLTLNIGIAIPIAVANIGAHEAALTFALTQLGLSATTGLAVATVHHLFQVSGVAVWLPVGLFARRPTSNE